MAFDIRRKILTTIKFINMFVTLHGYLVCVENIEDLLFFCLCLCLEFSIKYP